MTVPANDMIGAAARVAGNTVYVLDTTGATAETLEPVRLLATDVNGAQVTLDLGATLWFRLAVATPATLAVTTQDSGFDTILVVYSITETAGVPVWSSATLVAANDDQGGPTSALSFTAQPGLAYYVQVGGYEGAAGLLSIGFSGLSASGVSVIGSEAADLLQGVAAQAATMTGLAGNDTYRVVSEATQIVEAANAGIDTLVVTAAAANFLLNGGAEIEILRAEAGTAPINIGGNGFSQRIEGNDGANILSSGGGGGVDTMAGGLGDDVYRVFATGDVIEDTGGFDTLFASGTSYFLYASAAVEYLSTSEQAGTTPIYLVGNGASQVIAGNWGDNILNGRGGDGVAMPDTLIGLYGNDTYGVFSQGDVVREVAGQGNDVVYASTSYQLRAGTEIEALAAINGAATDGYALRGNEFAQTVVGNAGANTLDGGGGNDTLVGLAGADTFAFTTAPASANVDTIQDFASEDRIGLASDVFAAVAAGGIEAGEFLLGTTAQDADDRLLYDQTTGRLFYDADANGAGVAVLFAQLAAGTALTATSFVTVAPVSDLPGA